MYFLSNPPVYFLPGTWETVTPSIYEPVFGLLSFMLVIASATLVSSIAMKKSRKRV
jgi:hypothetical protein|tara:strand:- start:1429 stop:1596 length:168 start_codon:yes stop_codon:yes gene_type:complete